MYFPCTISDTLEQEEEQKLAIKLLGCLFGTHTKRAASESLEDILCRVYEKYKVSNVNFIRAKFKRGMGLTYLPTLSVHYKYVTTEG